MTISTKSASYPNAQKDNLLSTLRTKLVEELDNCDTYYAAFRELSLKILGYEDENKPSILDGANDRGFDAYRISGTDIDVFQFKSQDYTRKENLLVSADKDVFSDVPRILSFLRSPDFSAQTANKNTKKFINSIQTALQVNNPDDDRTFIIRVNVVALYDGMTKPAAKEFELIKSQNDQIKLFNKELLIEYRYLDLNFLIAQLWRENNTKWTDTTGNTNEWVNINFQKNSGGGYLSDRAYLVFFARARDLIDAYRRFGYQIFEST